MPEPPIEAPPRRSPRAEAAAAIYRRFHARCFWHCPPDLEITEERVPFVLKGLKAHGGREGFRLAAELERMPPPREDPEMPLTPFQKRIVRLIARNRNPDSHVAGGAVVNRDEASWRYSDDLDVFHDTVESLAAAVAIDERTLLEAGFAVEWTLRTDTLHRAEVALGDERSRLDWAADSAFRFFPAQEDEEFGYRLHRADLATNKILALAGRGEVRDFLDALQLDRDYLGFGAMTWAACGKDPGYTPDLILQQTNRHSRYREEDLERERLARPVDLKQLKLQWVEARQKAAELFERLPAEDLGCLYLDASGRPVTPDPSSEDFPKLTRHFGSVRGAWPRSAAPEKR